MTRDIEVLKLWLLFVVVLAAVAATAVPVLYSFFQWRRLLIGRLFMLLAVSFAAALDLTVIFQFWHPDILVEFWIDVIVFTAIAVSNVLMFVLMWKLYFKRKKGNENAPQ